jgi:formamidopyrimidine-DNA glycosylase
MPELPEVEVLKRHLEPLLRSQKISGVIVRRPKVLAPTSALQLEQILQGAVFDRISRRGKYLLFELRSPRGRERVILVGHLGMTGRMYLLPRDAALPKHAAVILDLGRKSFVFEDTRYFGRLTLDTGALERLGPEPLEDAFTVEHFAASLKRSAQPVKVKLLDQAMVSGIGNIYASEALFRAGVPPRLRARNLKTDQVVRLWRAIRETLAEAIEFGSAVPLDHAGSGERDGLFYFGRAAGAGDSYEERLRVYDRAGESCSRCGCVIRRLVQAARSTYYCPRCQRG